MPAIVTRAANPHQHQRRLFVGALVLVLLGTLGVATPAPVEGRNWTRDIAATRASQIYYERVMRAADGEVRALKRAQKHTRRAVQKAQRNLRAAVTRRGDTKRRLAEARTRLRSARVALAAPAFEPPPPPDAASAILVLTQPDDAVQPDDEVADAGSVVVRHDDVDLGFLHTSFLGVPTPFLRPASVQDVVALERQARKAQRSFKQARQRARRISRQLRVKRNALVAIHARQRGAIARRESAEAALGGRIQAMSRLAQRRVAKKTNVRPGVNSGFTWPTRGRISQTFGCTGFRLNPARGSCRHFHDGLDISGYRGTAIRAAAVGVVSYVGWNPWDQEGRAFMVVVAHPGGYESLYGHVLPSRQVRVGQLVHRGEVIGYMGSTGRSTGVHLHFELRRGGSIVNPLAFF